MNEQETIRSAMSILGSRTSEKKAAAARLNAKKPRKFKGNSHDRRKQRRERAK